MLLLMLLIGGVALYNAFSRHTVSTSGAITTAVVCGVIGLVATYAGMYALTNDARRALRLTPLGFFAVGLLFAVVFGAVAGGEGSGPLRYDGPPQRRLPPDPPA